MRDRLIELFSEAHKKCAKTKDCSNCVGYEKGVFCKQHLLADHLLAEGVIVPPCKVGDMVYRVMCRGVGDFFIREETVWIVDMHATAGLEITTKYVEGKGLTYFKRLDIEDFGKTIFLSREEAEKALAERSENGT